MSGQAGRSSQWNHHNADTHDRLGGLSRGTVCEAHLTSSCVSFTHIFKAGSCRQGNAGKQVGCVTMHLAVDHSKVDDYSGLGGASSTIRAIR